MNNKFLEFFGKIYMVKNNNIVPIEAVELRDIPELEDITIITISEEEIEQMGQKAKNVERNLIGADSPQLKRYSDRVRKHADAMLHELKHCRVNHPDDSWPWKSFDFVHQCSVMMEEAGEAVRAANTLRESSKGNLLSLYNELAQTGAMCLRIMEQIEDYALRLGKESGV